MGLATDVVVITTTVVMGIVAVADARNNSVQDSECSVQIYHCCRTALGHYILDCHAALSLARNDREDNIPSYLLSVLCSLKNSPNRGNFN